MQRLAGEVKVFGCRFGENIYPPPPPNLPVHWVMGQTFPSLFGSFQALLHQIDSDIIYAVKPKPTSFGVALLKKITAKRPILLDIDDWELSWFGGDEQRYRPTPRQFVRDLIKSDGALRRADHFVYLKWMEQLADKADAITVDTTFLQSRFGGVYLPNGKDTALFDPTRFDPEASRSRLGLSGYRVLMFPGTARPHKGLEDLLMALDQLNWPDLRLVIVGGRKHDNYEELLMERWGQWIIKLPRFSGEEMPGVVAAAHMVVVPQRDTPTAKAQFPLKLTDGMAMAKPILSTRVGDIPAILGEAGYLVDPSAPDQLAEQIARIFQNLDEANHKGLQARERCVQYYSVDAMATILAKVIAPIAV